MTYPIGHRRFGKGIPDRGLFLQERVFNKEIFPVERLKM